MRETYIVENKELFLDQKTFVDIVNSQYNNENIYVGFCELGYCVRAKKNILQGEFIYSFQGPIIDFNETTTRGETECMSLQFDQNKYIDTAAPGRFVNHSCEPNAGIFNDFDLYALDNIGIHEEIRFDYSTTMDENHYQMECKCGKPSCRKVVTDFILLPEKTKDNYLKMGIVMKFIQKSIAK